MLLDFLSNVASTPTHQVCPESGAWIFPVKPEEEQKEKNKIILDCIISICEAINTNTAVPQQTINTLKSLRG